MSTLCFHIKANQTIKPYLECHITKFDFSYLIPESDFSKVILYFYFFAFEWLQGSKWIGLFPGYLPTAADTVPVPRIIPQSTSWLCIDGWWWVWIKTIISVPTFGHRRQSDFLPEAKAWDQFEWHLPSPLNPPSSLYFSCSFISL